MNEELEMNGPEPTRTQATMGDMIEIDKFISLKIDEQAVITVRNVEFVEDEVYNLFHSSNARGRPYKVEITTTNDRVLSVTTWPLWNQIRKCFREMDKFEGVELSIVHVDKGIYNVSYQKGKIWTRV